MLVLNRILRRRLAARCICVAAAAVLLATLASAPAAAQLSAAPPADRAPPSPPPQSDNPGLVDEIQKLLKAPSSLLPSTSLLPSFGSDNKDSPQPAPASPAPQQSPPGSPPQAGPPSLPPPSASAPSASPTPPPTQSSPMVPPMVSGHQVCPVVPGSGPDCQAAADILCRSKGYRLGNSLGVDSTEKCSAKVLIPGRPREPGDCRTENFVTRAWCQ
uniref:Uncharacterized protein n=1 Tax=Rhodopseudomonas palustris (strain DX-1) TaxID=652103 RepID=E6VFW4_RHOPX